LTVRRCVMDTIECRKVIAIWLAVALLSLMMLTACGNVLEVGVETTPTTDAAATATVSAPTTENARLATQVATLAVPTPTLAPSLGKLTYVQGGDIWVKALHSGEPQRLTTDGRNSQPRWSPSSEWLAFRKDEQVWLMSADGKDARSLNEGTAVDAFAWAPADDRLAYVAVAGLQVISADGLAPVTLVTPSLPGHGPGRMGRIAWSPDGAWIACEWQEWQPDQPLTYQGLWKVSANGEQLAELYASGAPEKGEAVLAGWSLDGQHIFFWQGDVLSASIMADGVALYSLPAGGDEPIKLVDAVLVHGDFLAPAPRGDRLAVTAGGYRATWTNKRVAVVEAGGGELTWLTDESEVAFSPAWSPDGAQLAYVAMPDEGDLVGGEDARLGMMERRIWVADTQGESQLHQLTDDPAYRDEHPLWSADGSHLLFARLDAEGRASLWLIPAGGGGPHRVVDELTPLPGPASGWFGYYGHVDWDQLFDWWRGPVVQQVQAPTSTLPAHTLRPLPSAEAHDLDSARQALMAYFSLLHERRYSEAISYYGGTYDILRDWNPTVAQDDYATLFKNGCTMNGLKCLSIRTIVRGEKVSPIESRFTVEFTNDDGSLFVLGPCCGATEVEMSPKTQFVYTVKRVKDRFLVQDLPVYVP
jgi:Tol biopolymer transport system component